MNLPYLSSQPYKSLVSIGTFGGLDERPTIDNNFFADTKNVSSRFYPTLTTRQTRGDVLGELSNPNGLFWKNAVFYVDGVKAYYDFEQIPGLQLKSGMKQLVGMGAYIIIMPDKIAYDTNTKTWKTLGAKLTQSFTATFAPLSAGSAYTKITLSGIDDVFNQYDAVTITGCTNASYNTTKIITETGTDFIVVTGALDSSFTQASGLKFERSVPDMDFVCEHNNRLWGCSSKNHEIYASKLGDPFNWNAFEGISTDSYVLSVGSDGDFTACVAHMGYVIFFKEQYIHVMYGDKPSNYSLNTKQLPGVKTHCAASVQIINETLYYVGRSGVYAYNGAIPVCISDNLTKPMLECIGGKQDDIYYLSCERDGKSELLTFDTKRQLWHKQDDLRFRCAAFGEGVLYYIDSDGNLSTITGERDEHIEWYAESGDIVEGSIDQKYVSKIRFNFWMDSHSEANIFMKYDDGPIWERVGTVKSIKNMTYVFNIIPKRCNKYRYRIEGYGQFKLFGMAREVEGGSEVNGSIYSGYRR